MTTETIQTPPNVLLSGIVGSTAYGLATEDSDVDRLVRPCPACGASDRYPSGKCRPCTQKRNAVNAGYFKDRNATMRAQAIKLARLTSTRQGVIYGLYDPSGPLRYVGQTQQTVARRLSGHLCGFRGSNRHLPVNRWIAKLVAAGLEPAIRVLAGPMPVADLDDAERSHIAEARSAGARLLNVSDGGLTPLKKRYMPEDAIRRSAEAKRGKPRPPEVRAKLSAANAGKKNSPATRAKMSSALKGKKQSPDWIRKRVEACKQTKMANNFCGRGHERTEENTRWYRGQRHCRACAREDAQARREAAKLAEAGGMVAA